MKIHPNLYRKAFKKGTLKPKIKKGSATPFFTVFVQIFAGEKSQISVQLACGDHIVLIRKTDDICFSLYIKIIGKCRKKSF